MTDSDILEQCEGGVLIRVFVKTSSPRLRFPAGVEEGFVTAEVRSPPVGGKANRELVKTVAKFFGVSSSSISIVRGVKDRNKVIKVMGVSVDSVKDMLGV